MKQYSSPEQAAKLIELGLPEPKSIEKVTYIEQYGCCYKTAYSIGELIEMLLHKPFCSVSICNIGLRQHKVKFKKLIKGKFKVLFREIGCEPIDLLFNCIVKLKEEGVI